MPQKTKSDLRIEQAQRLFVQRVYIVTHIVAFILAIVLTRGKVAGLGILFVIWTAVFMLHAVYFALYENREAVLRRNYEDDYNATVKGKNDDSETDGYYTLGTDGELIPLDDEGEVKRNVK